MYQIKHANLESPLLNVLDGHTKDPFTYSIPLGTAMGTKSTHIINPKLLSYGPGGNSSCYGRRYIFDVPQKFGYLAQAFIECTLTCTGDNTAAEDRLGSRIFSVINMATRNGLRNIQTLSPQYTTARMDGLDAALSSHVESSVEPNEVFNNNTIVCYRPCFFYFSERPQNFYNTDLYEPIIFDCTTGPDKESMGLLADLTNCSFRLVLTFFSMFRKTESQIPRSLSILSYDIFSEPPKALANGATSVKINLTCPYTVFCMHISALSDTNEHHRTKGFTLIVDNKTLTTIDRRTNYSLFTPEQTESTTGSFTYWFSLEKNRYNNTMSLPLKTLEPVELVVTFDDAIPDNTYSLHVMFEYWTILDIDTAGTVSRRNHY